jgi:hypothetical protein
MSNLINLPNNYNFNLFDTNEFNLPILQSGTATFQYDTIDKVVSRAVQINVGDHTTTDCVYSFSEMASLLVDKTQDYTIIVGAKAKSTINLQMQLFANSNLSQTFDFNTSQDDNFESFAQVLELSAGVKYDINFIVKSNALNNLTEIVKMDAFCLSPKIFGLNTNFIITPNLKKIQTSWMLRGSVTLGADIVINNNTKVDLTAPIFGGTILNENNAPLYYDAVNNLIRSNADTIDFYSFDIVLILSGSISSGGTGDIFEITLHRPNEDVFRRFLWFSPITTDNFISNQVSVISTFVGSGGTDNWQLPLDSPPAIAGGFRIKINRIKGNANLTLDNTGSQQIRLQR